MEQQINTELSSIGTTQYPIFTVEHNGTHIKASVFDTADDNAGKKEGKLIPNLPTLKSYGIAQVVYLDSGYDFTGGKDAFLEAITELLEYVRRIHDEEASVLLHVNGDDIDMLHNALVFMGFNVDASLNNGAFSLAAYTINI